MPLRYEDTTRLVSNVLPIPGFDLPFDELLLGQSQSTEMRTQFIIHLCPV